MIKYTLHVYCRRNGMTCDAGIHAANEYETNAEAKRELRREALWLQKFYDEIHCTVKKEDETIETYSLRSW